MGTNLKKLKVGALTRMISLVLKVIWVLQFKIFNFLIDVQDSGQFRPEV